MSYIPSDTSLVTLVPAEIRAPGTVPTYGAFPGTFTPDDENYFPVDPGTKYINVILRINQAIGSTQTYYIKGSYSIILDLPYPSFPGGFSDYRSEVYVAGPPAYYDQVAVQKRFVGITGSASEQILTATFDLENLSPKWFRVNVSCTNTAATPTVAIAIVQGK